MTSIWDLTLLRMARTNLDETGPSPETEVLV